MSTAPVTNAAATAAPEHGIADAAPSHAPLHKLPDDAGTTRPPSKDVGQVQADHGMSALYLGDLHWWTSDAHIQHACADIGLAVSLADITFSEHKVNGKSKGVAHMKLHSAERALLAKNWFESHDFQNKRMTPQLAPDLGGRSPFQTLPKEPVREPRSVRHVSGPAALGRPNPSVKLPTATDDYYPVYDVQNYSDYVNYPSQPLQYPIPGNFASSGGAYV